MSARIEETLEVMEAVAAAYRHRAVRFSVTAMRQAAVREVAAARGIRYQTVVDKLLRQLRPECRTVDDFDVLLRGWLREDDPRLHEVLLNHAVDSSDAGRIRQFFRQAKAAPFAIAV